MQCRWFMCVELIQRWCKNGAIFINVFSFSIEPRDGFSAHSILLLLCKLIASIANKHKRMWNTYLIIMVERLYNYKLFITYYMHVVAITFANKYLIIPVGIMMTRMCIFSKNIFLVINHMSTTKSIHAISNNFIGITMPIVANN